MNMVKIILIVLILIFAVSSVSATDNSTEILAEDNSDSGNIQNLVNNAKDNDTIQLTGYYNIDKSIDISKPLTIEGVNATLDGGKKTAIFSSHAEVCLKNICFTNMRDSGIYSTSKLVIINCTFINNNHVLNSRSDVEIINSSFINNMGYNLIGHEIYGYKLSLINCNFTNNVANNGMIKTYSVDAENCNFKDNNGSVFMLKNSDFTYYNGTVYGSIIKNSMFINNYAENGGAISALNADLAVNNCTFNKNHAQKNGGDIYAANSWFFFEYIGERDFYNFPKIKIFNSTSTGSAAVKGAFLYSTFCNVELINSTSDNDVYIKIGNLTQLNNTVKNINQITEIKSKIMADKLTTQYHHVTEYRFSLEDEDNERLYYKAATVKLYTGKTYKTYNLIDRGDGDFAFFDISDLKVGKYKVEITFTDKYYAPCKITTSIIIQKAKLNVKAPKITSKYKKSKNFKVTVKSKKSGLMSKFKIKIKVFTGKIAKTFKVKTNKKGIAKLNTKSLSKGKHKVIITSANNNYKINAKSSIIIK